MIGWVYVFLDGTCAISHNPSTDNRATGPEVTTVKYMQTAQIVIAISNGHKQPYTRYKQPPMHVYTDRID